MHNYGIEKGNCTPYKCYKSMDISNWMRIRYGLMWYFWKAKDELQEIYSGQMIYFKEQQQPQQNKLNALTLQ